MIYVVLDTYADNWIEGYTANKAEAEQKAEALSKADWLGEWTNCAGLQPDMKDYKPENARYIMRSVKHL